MLLKLAVLCLGLYCTRAEWYEESAAQFSGDQGTHLGAYNKFLAGWSLERVKSIMGTRLDGINRKGILQREHTPEAQKQTLLTSQFTCGVDKWRNCAGTINYIKDQASCGSCWAVAASELIADRICIANYASIPTRMDGLNEARPTIDMSAEQILACCNWCGDGCQGGYPIDAMRYWSYNGVVTGGWYGSNCGCQPYQIRPCGSGGCQEGVTPACSHYCRPGYSRTFDRDLHRATNYYMLRPSAANIQAEIMYHGPVECGYTVYENFMSYRSGVYTQARGRMLGGHAVKVIGWGTENGVPYWLINNSWNVTWGMNGIGTTHKLASLVRAPAEISDDGRAMATERKAHRSHSPAIRNFFPGSYERSEFPGKR